MTISGYPDNRTKPRWNAVTTTNSTENLFSEEIEYEYVY